MKNNKGFSIVELMVAMLLGLIIMGGVVQVLTGSQASYNELVQQARMQETGKIALDYIVRDLRNLGYFGCNGQAMQVANSIETTSPEYFNGTDVLRAWTDGSANPPPSSDYGDVVAGSDVIQMQLLDISGALSVVSHQAISAVIFLNEEHEFKPGTVWAVVDRDCSNIGMFEQSGPANNNGNAETVVHNTGSGGLGNCTKALKGNFNCDNFGTNGITQAYSPGSSVFVVQTIAYTIEPSGANADINSLHRRTLDVSGDTEELIDGVDGLRFRFGLDTDGDGYVDTFASADAVNSDAGLNFLQAISIAIEVDVSTYEDAGFSSQTFTTSVRLRNRGLS